ncbi:MAG: hypothetical protein ABSG03_20115 [Bryobacteraceae bacterium]|jgi:hypothetical protein
MSGRANHVEQIAAMTSMLEVAPHAAALKAHLRSITESPAFKGSRRSQEFLQFIVARALDGHFDDLKERVLGVELFGRSPSYDTGDDAIVRVTACDVRKRLNQYYVEFAHQSDFRIELPPGSYIPDIHSVAPPAPAPPAKTIETAQIAVTPSTDSAAPMAGIPVEAPVPARRTRLVWFAAAALAAITIAGLAFWVWKARRPAEAAASPEHTLPWSAMIQPNRQIRLVFCDPEIVSVQHLLNYSITLSDYANQRYWPADVKPEARRVLQTISFRGASVAAVDAEIALKMDGLILPFTKRSMQMQPARNVRLGDFKTEDSFVLFGSPRSNPWLELFQDQLDFSFEFDDVHKAEFVRNRHPGNGEAPAYIPTAAGWGTGQAYGIVALVGNPGQNGQVLLLAGSSAEATEAAGKVATNFDALSKILKSAGIDANGRVRHFEILLRVSTMAGLPNTYDVVACHPLNGRP